MGGRLRDKVALITGAASLRGMGFAAARRFAAEGASVMLTDVDGEAAATAAAAIESGHGVVAGMQLDVTSEASWQRAMQATTASFGKLHILVNNAGVALFQPLTACTADDFDRLSAVNLRGVFIGTREAVVAMRAHGEGGSIINVSSVAGMVGVNYMSIYAATKGGIRLLSKSVALETARENIRCNSVHPGMVDTDFFHAAAQADPEISKAIIAAIPAGRLGRAEEVANCLLFLASDEASYITGAEFAVDGGYTAQ